jgi:hypothetical protein
MRPGIGLIVLLAGIALAQERPNALTPKESSEGWMLLFDGKSLNGWEIRGASDWKVEDGAMACSASGASWIGTDAMFADYVLRIQFRGTAKVNSGIFLRSQKTGEPHITGYELQIWDYQPAGFLTGSLVGTVKAGPAKVIGDEWNSYEVTASGDHFVIVLNGSKVLDTKDSKHSSGVVGLQCQPNNPIQFRNIKLKPIKK